MAHVELMPNGWGIMHPWGQSSLWPGAINGERSDFELGGVWVSTCSEAG